MQSVLLYLYLKEYKTQMDIYYYWIFNNIKVKHTCHFLLKCINFYFHRTGIYHEETQQIITDMSFINVTALIAHYTKSANIAVL